MSDSLRWRDQVVAFLEALNMLRGSVLQGVPHLATLGQLIGAARQGVIPRSGVIGNIEYQIHGRGVLMIDVSGREVDVDFLPDGSAIFDPWRILRFSRQPEGLGQEVGRFVEGVCRTLVVEDVLREPVAGWFCATDEPVHQERVKDSAR
ncbi:DUF6896 domain-containing protein [Micromonospora zamorensis]|uniref:DUF6896 domain-containing protein n=1 Tax=Micromonospora zamorensis TaxID=709883 RepID=UPI002ED0C38C|nr:hypothetical protein OG886_20235 [Micromonospora zamorensis]